METVLRDSRYAMHVFRSEEGQPAHEHVVLLGDGHWRRKARAAPPARARNGFRKSTLPAGRAEVVRLVLARACG
jgi:hypothetical protein